MNYVPFKLLVLLGLGCGAQPIGQKGGDDDTGGGGSTVVTFGGVEVQPSSFEFGDVEIGSTASGTWVVDNDGSDPVIITTAFVEGTGYTSETACPFLWSLLAVGSPPEVSSFPHRRRVRSRVSSASVSRVRLAMQRSSCAAEA